eukprot:COSAG02_NODE_44832_length_362_cov_1.178707_2_plen_41_part_01
MNSNLPTIRIVVIREEKQRLEAVRGVHCIFNLSVRFKHKCS